MSRNTTEFEALMLRLLEQAKDHERAADFLLRGIKNGINDVEIGSDFSYHDRRAKAYMQAYLILKEAYYK